MVASGVGGSSLTVNPLGTQLYTTDGSTIRTCPINITNGTLGTCIVAATGFSSTNGIQFNKNGTRVYVTNSNTNIVNRCIVNSIDGTFNPCVNSGITGLNAPRRSALLNVA